MDRRLSLSLGSLWVVHLTPTPAASNGGWKVNVKFLKQGVCLALLGAGLAALPGTQATAAERPAGPSLVEQMRESADGSVDITAKQATGKVGFIRAAARGDLMPSVRGDSLAGAVDKATAYVTKYGAAFGAARGELHQSGVLNSKYGWTVTFTQSYRGVPVFGSMLKANVDKAGDLTSVSGYAAPGLSLSTTPRVSEATASSRAVATVVTDPPGDGRVDTSGVKAAKADLVVYRLGSTRSTPGTATLAWLVDVSDGANIREAVFIDALSGKIVNRYSTSHAFETKRVLYEADENRDFTEVWRDGDPFPGTLNSDQQNLVATAGNSYWLYANTFGRDSYDGEGAPMLTVNNDPAIECPNANWNGYTTNYCNGVTSDDVVAHEWGHAYTDYTSGLIYQWQSGALNESYSDVWGETIDLINYGRNDQGEGNLDAKRPDGVCSAYTRGPVTATINAPAAVAGPCEAAAPASFGPVFTADGVTSDVVVGTDAADDGSPTNGCSAFTNAAAISGKWVYVDRGECVFTDKVAHAEDAGATGIVVGQNNPDEAPFSITDDSDIYGVMVAMSDGTRIKSAGAVNMTVRDASETPGADSYRWLMGEKSPAFGGAIRDMWNPTCYGNAGKVSDAEYVCDLENDGGGVHQNSGIPNHAYALLVDGGDYNGVTVPGIGLDKAANIWWLTQTQHLTPTSDFTDFAEGLDASCQTLIGQEILGLETKRETPGTAVDPITPADCIAVAAAADAVELRAEPTQCNYKPLLKKGSPAPCGKGTTSRTVWNENFSDGLKGWDRTHKVAKGATGFPWRVRNDARGHEGNNAAFAPDPVGTQCVDPAENFSSRNGITSPTVRLPDGGGVVASRLVFDHYVATEEGWDGGIVSVSVNGGRFKKVPGDAYMLNGYTGRLFNKKEGSSNPLRGMTTFTGSDGGTNHGSWGQSQVNLTKLHVERGDKVRIRFDFGRDLCMGREGWFVDNVKVVVCKDKAGRRQELATKR